MDSIHSSVSDLETLEDPFPSEEEEEEEEEEEATVEQEEPSQQTILSPSSSSSQSASTSTSSSAASSVIPLRANVSAAKSCPDEDPAVSAPYTPPTTDLTVAPRSVTPTESDANIPEIGAVSTDEEEYVSADDEDEGDEEEEEEDDDDDEMEASSSTSSSLPVLEEEEAIDAISSLASSGTAIDAMTQASTSAKIPLTSGANCSSFPATPSSSSTLSSPPYSPSTLHGAAPLSHVMKFKPQVDGMKLF